MTKNNSLRPPVDSAVVHSSLGNGFTGPEKQTDWAIFMEARQDNMAVHVSKNPTYADVLSVGLLLGRRDKLLSGSGW